MTATEPTDTLRVEELAHRAGLGVDTVRYYQAQGLLAAPRRLGRTAWYGIEHLDRLHQIRELADRGFTLAQIAELDSAAPDPLLQLLAVPAAAEPGLDVAELARRSGLDPSVVQQVADLGLIRGTVVDGHPCYPPAVAEALTVVARVVEAGVPLEALRAIAIDHAAHVERLADQVVELYRTHRTTSDRAALVSEVEQLVPLVATMLGTHFEASVLEAAARRLEDDDS